MIIYRFRISLIYGSKITLRKIKFLTVIFFSLVGEIVKDIVCPKG